MKVNLLRIAIMVASLVLSIAAMYIYQGGRQAPQSNGQSETLDAIPRDYPWPVFGYHVSLEEARSRVPYPIPLPGYVPGNATLKDVMVGFGLVADQPADPEIALIYSNGLEVVIHPVEGSAEEWKEIWEAIVAEGHGLKSLINVRGTVGEGHEAGATKTESGELVPYPTVVSWWEGGFIISIYSDYLPLSELLRVVESLPPISRGQ